MQRSIPRRPKKPLTPTESISHLLDLSISTLNKSPTAWPSLKHLLRTAAPNLLLHAATTLLEIHLTQPDSITRFHALTLLARLFDRSHVIRGFVVQELPVLLQRTVGIQGFIVPGPQEYTIKCKELALRLMSEWYTRFGKVYRHLEIARFQLRRLGLYRAGVEDSVEARREAARRDRVKRERHVAYLEMMKEWDERRDELVENQRKMEELFGILVDEMGGKGGGVEEGKRELMSHKGMVEAYGLGTTAYSLEIEIDAGNATGRLADPETEENKILYDELRECQKIHGKLIDSVQKWIRVVSTPAVLNGQLKQLLDWKSKLETANSKANILLANATLDEGEDDDDEFEDEIFEEIPIVSEPLLPDFGSKIVDKVKASGGGSASVAQPIVAQQQGGPSSSQPRIPKQRVMLPAGSSMEALLKAAPIVDFNQDLYYWDKKSVPFNTSGIEFHHRFLGEGRGENLIPEHIMQDLRKRTVVVEPERVEYPPCRARLKNGALCPRRDKFKCPMHGVIVARDDRGDALDPREEGKGKGKAVVPLWEELEQEVNQGVGEASIPKKKGPVKTALQEELEILKRKDGVKDRMEKAMKRTKKSK
ncbi:hypothetical protein HDU98_002357 [Podochytrium sp. JEL0797]|nr:hypothetical protein HDU98_002357 [Podochytrium sp. JEL0797]